MAGTIFVTERDLWSASSSAFHWVGSFLRDRVGADTRDHIDEVLDNNLGAIVLEDLPVPGREEVLGLLARELVPDAERRLPVGLPGRDSWVETFRELAEMARRAVS